MLFMRSITIWHRSMLDTDQLRSFLAIVDTGSFTRAADRVNKTQSAVSMHVRRLEERLDRALFVKQGRGTRLSPDGERLVEHARRILQVEAAALADLAAEGLTGRVTLGIPDDYAELFLGDIVGRFALRHPGVELSVLCHPSIEVADRIRSGEVDVGIVTASDDIPGSEVLREEPLVWVAGLRAGPIEAQRPLPLALSTPSCAWRQVAIAALAEAGVATRMFMTSTHYSAIAPVVRAGQAVTVLPLAVVDAASQRLVGAEAGLPALPSVRLGLLRRPGARSPVVAALADEVRASLGAGAAAMRDAA
ncbi:LysR family transcriptional regulator [Lichenibacterium minor]|uniref:LysR family transcriptional regulator n=2 Tax=Lichenibacterium minor TaxID=2316528 RepID=A0A4Q2UAW0_9HYPH|nr:LysR family transcriptional regulator [Lichenibacterium minor]